MTTLVRAIHSLETLSLNCSVEKFPIGAIHKHGPGLRVLCLREIDGVVHQPLRQDRVPTLSLHALLEIQSHCPNIMELALDLDQGMIVRNPFAISSIQSPFRSYKVDENFCSRPVSQACLPKVGIFAVSQCSCSNPSSAALISTMNKTSSAGISAKVIHMLV